MSENQSLRVPSCRRHKPSGQAAVTVNGQDICPGTWNTWASKAEYNRLIAEFLTHGRQLQSGVQQTVVEVLNAYRAFAENDYRKGDQVTREYSGIKDALKLVRELYGRTIANDFGPLALKTVRTRKSKRTRGEHYTTANYRRAIHRACNLAFPAPEPLCRGVGESVESWQEQLTEKQQAELTQWHSDHRCSPNQLRHSAGTEIRKRFGLEAAQVVLGHASADVTQVCAERDLQFVPEFLLHSEGPGRARRKQTQQKSPVNLRRLDCVIWLEFIRFAIPPSLIRCSTS
jgi:hypothetical protein